MLIDCWAQLSRDTLNQAIDQLSERLTTVIKAKGAHEESHLDLLCMLMITVVTFTLCLTEKIG